MFRTMEHQFTYEHLSKNPTGLLHKRNTADPIGPFDGKLGALVEEGWFMVTPNASGLYQPPLGINREMYIQADFRYGADDPLLWLQFYVRSNSWLGCVRKRPKDPLDPFLPLYDSVTRSDFSTFSYASQDNQLGTFSSASFTHLQTAAKKIIDMSESQMASWGASHSLLRDFRSGLLTLLHCLEFLPFIFDRLCLTVTETQHIAIEMRAIMEYITIYRPCMLVTNQPPRGSIAADKELIGVFTTDPIIVEEFYRAKIPYLTLRSPCIRLRSVFIGASDQAEEYKAFQHFTRNHMRLLNPFALVPDQVRSDPPLPEPLPSTSRSKPYDRPIQREKQVQPSPSSQIGFLSVVVHPRLPPAVLVWRAAVEATSSDRSRCYPEARVPEANRYIFPWPDIFIGVQDERKSLELMKVWLCLHPLLLARVSCSSYSAQLMAHQSWRVILNLDRLMKAARTDGASSSRGMPTKAAKRREQAVDFLQGCAGELRIDTDFNVGAAVWRGIELEQLTDDHHCEISWELAELNFRFELFALDARAATNGGNHDLLLHCIPHGLTTAFAAVDIGSANHRLGHPTWRQRAPYVFPLINTMWSWRACPDLIQQKKTGYTEAEFTEMEKCATVFYTESFFCFFGRAPVIPRHLSHSPQTMFVPETHEDVYTERPGLVFDLAQFRPLP
ncbi:hypothetical protein EDD18DRAFT_1356282 [Armillaria luteobubalina]|uniref:Uncharacterized protein n=1 Tax=Armillaria luteobubalina TaxID=153913 RepID=A0AA39Q054_9AGAR|nr:hypothetical protein EDD18DRAFT_1356282 [Armillaria luteobubalina]